MVSGRRRKLALFSILTLIPLLALQVHSSDFKDRLLLAILGLWIAGAWIIVERELNQGDRARARAEKERAEMNVFLDSIIENIPHMIFVKDARDLRFVRFNKAGEELLGYPRGELIGKNDYDFFSKSEADFFTQKDRETLERGEVVDVTEEPIETRHKGVRILHTKKIPLKGLDGRALFLLGISEDITERKHAEQALHDSSAEIRDLYNNAPCGYHSVDSEGTFVEMNDTELSWLGYSRTDVIGRMKISHVLAEDSRKLFEWHFAQFKRRGEIRGLELDLIRKDGRAMPVIMSATGVYDAGGNFVKSRTTLFDLTERKRAEELARSNRELELFARTASHDLKEPLRKILHFGDRLKEKLSRTLEPDDHDSLERMTRAGARMGRLIDDLLLFSKVAVQPREQHEIDLSQAVREALADLEMRVQETRAAITVGSLPTLRGEPVQIRQLFQNLLSNALKFCKKEEPPRIEISGREFDGQVEVTIRDNGIGFPEREKERIFRPFQRVHSEFEGTGLGLSICQKIVESHGGTLAAESSPGQGCLFRLTLPKQGRPAESS